MPKPTEGMCTLCGECWSAALCRNTTEGQVVCQNCAAHTAYQRQEGTSASTHWTSLHQCPICLRKNVPGQFHHVASARQYARLGLRLCLNCHAILTYRQMAAWDASWRTEAHPLRCLTQGLLDVLWLWWQRSDVSWSLREVARLAWLAGLALGETIGVKGWGQHE